MTRGGVAIVALVGLLAAAGGWYLVPSVRAKAVRSSGVEIIPVTAGTAELKDVPVYVRGLGTVQANATVTVRSRVDGQIVKVAFTEGQQVKSGDLLFQIDPRPFQAALDQAVATRQKDQAQLAVAQINLERYGRLLNSGAQTREAYDDQKALVGQLQATVKADQAQIDTAQINLSYSEVRAPIDGRTGARLVDIGNIVQANQGAALVSLTQVKPIFVSFTVPQDTIDAIRQAQAQGTPSVAAFSSDDATPLATGKLSLIDNQVDVATGTIRLKAVFDNADERLWPGAFVNAHLILSTREQAVTVPMRTVMQGPNGPYVYVIKPDRTVERRALKVAATQDGLAVIQSGLAAGEAVVVDGQYRLVDGSKVRTDTNLAAEARP